MSSIKSFSYILTIDHGNTNPHAGLFQYTKGVAQLLEIVPLSGLDAKQKTYGLNQNNTFALASVVGEQEKLDRYLEKLSIPTTSIQNFRRPDRFFEMPVHYTETLGQDRLIQCYDLYDHLRVHKQEFRAVLIDSGTFTTTDFISERGFQGGHIFPGTCNLLQAYALGANLPLYGVQDLKSFMNQRSAVDALFKHGRHPQTTEEAILSSVLSLQKMICEFVLKEKHVTDVVLTGGKARIFNQLMQEVLETREEFAGISVQIEDNYIHHSLCRLGERILSYSAPELGLSL